MSPAMVDVRSPVTESRIKSQQSRLIDPNPKKGQSSSSSSSTLAFGFSDKPVSERLKSETGPMASPNQKNGAGFYAYGFSMPPPPPPTKSEKPNLSKPRLVKVRRHLGSQRAEQSARSGTESRGYLSSNASGDGIVGETRDAFQEWNPFSSVPSKSVGANSAPLQFGSSVGSATFVFGAGKASGPGSSLNSIGGNVSQGVQSFGDHVFVRPGGGAVFSSGSNESGKVGSSSNLMPSRPIESLEEKLPNEIRKLKIDDLPDQSTGSGLGTKMNNTGVSENVQNLGSVEFGISGADASFAFRTNQSTGVWSSSNSVPSDKLREKLSDETGNYNAGARVNHTSVQPESQSGVNSCSSACNNIGNCAAVEGLMFSASQSSGLLKTDMKNSRTVEGSQSLGGLNFKDSSFNSKVVFPASQQSHVGNTSDTKPSESIGGSFQDDVQKLNTKIGTTESGVELDGANGSVFAEGPSNSRSFRFDKSGGDNGFIFGAENLGGSTSGNDMSDMFPQNVGQNYQPAAAPGLKPTPGGLNRGYEDTLPSEIKKLNIKDETRFENNKNKIYTFEFKQRESSNVSKKSNPEEVWKTSTMASMEKSVQDELSKLSIANEHAFQSKGEAGCTYTTKTRANMIPNMGKGFGADVFVFGSKGNTNGGVSDQNSTVSFDEKTDIKLSNDMKKLSVEEMMNGSEDIKDKDISPTPRDASRDVRRSGKDDAQESSTCKNFPKNTESGNFLNRPLGDSTSSRSIPTPFTFQAGKKTNGLGMDDVPPVILDANAKPSAIAPSSSSSSFSGLSFPSEINTSEGTATSNAENKAKFPNMGHELNVPVFDPHTPKHEAFSAKNMVFSAKKVSKETATKSKKKRGKLKSRTGLVHQQHFISREGSSQESSEMSSPIYSPMDFSPYQEDTAADQFSRETSQGSDDIIQQSVGMDAQSDQKFGGLSKESFMHGPPENESLPCQEEMTNFNNAVGVSGANTSVSNIESQPGVAKSMSGVEDSGRTNFTFAAFPSSQGPSSTRRRHYRKKSLIRDAHDSYTSAPNSEVHMNSPPQFSPSAATVQGQNHCKEDVFISQKVKDKESSIHQQSVSAALAQEACEKWRLRGNQAYANGDLSKAENCYTQGVKCVFPKETSRTCVRALMLCYSNRAATRMSLGRMREALQDCMMAASIEPNFHRVQLRAANCYLALGETEDALKHFKNCFPSGGDLSLDRKIVIEASDGLQKAKQVFAYMNECTKLLLQRTSDNAVKALELTAKALLISSHSESLIEMKAEALLMLRKYEDVIHLCEETMDSAEKNCAMSNSDTQSLEASSRCKESPAKLWRWHLISKCYFYMGRLEEALDFLQKHEIGGSTEDINNNLESATAFVGTIQELLRHKAAGNEAFQAGRHSEAVEHYSAALSCSVESRPFAAICFCNRAAAYQALGQIADAIADCCLAIALDSNYPKAISRRATLHEMIRDYGQATSDLRRLLSLLERQSEDTADQSKTLGRSTSTTNDIRQARARLATVEEEAKKEVPMDMYLILGIESSAAAVDIKKAYRKAALRHHPDKAGQFFARSENGDDGLLKEVFDDVHKDADRLFKMIGEAYAVLSDPTKRLRYDAEEEIRNAQKKGGTPKSPVDIRNHPFDKSSSRRQWRETWKTYESSQPRWSESSRSHRY